LDRQKAFTAKKEENWTNKPGKQKLKAKLDPAGSVTEEKVDVWPRT